MQTAYIALGANLASLVGPPEATLAATVKRLNDLGKITAQSSLYSTAPVGLADQPRFVNAVVALETELEPRALLNKLLKSKRSSAVTVQKGFRMGHGHWTWISCL